MESVSVIIPAFNASGSIERAIRSALDQSFPPAEILVIDDASSDDTFQKTSALSAKDAHIKLLRLPTNGGPAVARNFGIEHAQSDWIALLDADDAFQKDRLRILIQKADEENADFAADNILNYDAGAQCIVGQAIDPANIGNGLVLSLRTFLKNCQGNRRGMIDLGLLKPIFKRRFVLEKNIRYPGDVRHAEDFEFYLRALQAGAKVILIPNALYLYTQRLGPISGLQSSQSQTTPDYRGIALRTRRIAQEDTFRHQPDLAALLYQRADAADGLAVEHELHRHIRNGQYGRLVWRVLKYPRATWALARFVYSALKRQFRISPNYNCEQASSTEPPSPRSMLFVCHKVIMAVIRRLPAMRCGVWNRYFGLMLKLRHTYPGRTYFGARIPCDIRDIIQRCIFYFGVWEPNVSRVIDRRLGKNDLFVDVGANIGYHTLLASKVVGAGGSVVAFDASPTVFCRLIANVESNHATNVRAVNVAISDHEGDVVVYSGPIHNTGRTTTLAASGLPEEATVRCAPLDVLLTPDERSRVKLLKIDIEGAEHSVMSRVLETLGEYSPNMELIVELSSVDGLEWERRNETFETFLQKGFHAYMLDNPYDAGFYLYWRKLEPPQEIFKYPSAQADVFFTRTPPGAYWS